jgi:hypothetical protein
MGAPAGNEPTNPCIPNTRTAIRRNRIVVSGLARVPRCPVAEWSFQSYNRGQHSIHFASERAKFRVEKLADRAAQGCSAALEALSPILDISSRRMKVIGGRPQRLETNCNLWNELVLEPEIQRLVQRDFESFFARKEWFQRHRLPFKRGYLFYGPPGNGKTSVIRAMASRPHLALFSVNFNNDEVDDSALSAMLEEARNIAPALVVLEDLDRLFPRDESKRCDGVKVSISGLLNGLDGIAVQ